MSQLLFNIGIEELVREAAENLEENIKVGGKWIKELRFACDQPMIARNWGGLQAMWIWRRMENINWRAIINLR